MTTPQNRRAHSRYKLPVGYVPVEVRIPGRRGRLEGHAYDISQGGLRFEIDEPLPPGTRVTIELKLPKSRRGDRIRAIADVVWVGDVEDPAPYKMAARFAEFINERDASTLAANLDAGRFSHAA